MQVVSRKPAAAEVQQPDDRLTLPGVTLPLDYTPIALNQYGVKTRSLFPTVLDDRDIESGYIEQPVMTLRERKMLKLLNEMTDRPLWVNKVFDDGFIQNWKKQISHHKDVTPKMIEWLVTELRYKAKIAQKTGCVSIFTGDVVKTCIDAWDNFSFKNELAEEILTFENKLGGNIEYKMVTEDREIDYVHPSFFPVVFGKTRVLRDRVIDCENAVSFMGKGEILPVPSDPGPSRKDLSWNIASRSDIMPRPYSSRFQWLPSDVYFRPDGTCYFASYINNIHPQRDRHLYPVLERLLDKVIPMFDLTLTPVKTPVHSCARIEMQNVAYEKITPGSVPEKPTESPNESRYAYEERLRDWRRKYFKAVQPDAGEFTGLGIPPQMMDELPAEQRNKHRIADVMDLKKEYGHRGLQVIVRIDDNTPDPKNPIFEVPWHMEGQINEHICASAMYYYESKNIESIKLNFRQISDTQAFQDLSYERGDTVWLEQVYGLSHDGSTVQEVGGIECSTGRIVCWPNTLQHNAVIKLADPLERGHAHSVNFLLIDPNIRIISTANVPPQRLDWKPEAEKVGLQNVTKLSLEEKLKIIPREGDFPWALQEAKEILAQNREDRLKFNHYQNVAFHSKNVFV